MKSKMIITPIININYQTLRVIDNSNMIDVEYEWDDVVPVFDTKEGIETHTTVSDISLYDDRLIINGEQHHILHMISK